MIDKVFAIGDFVITPFGVLLVLSFLAAFWQLRRGLVSQGIGDDEDASTLLFAAGIGGIVGGKSYYAILYRDWSLLFDRAGLVWYGGFIGGLIAVLIALNRRRLPFWPTVDVVAPGLALGYAVGRIGCFLVGDDYGVPTDRPWGVVFEKGLPPTTAGNLRDYFGVTVPDAGLNDWVAVHPTQLYETLIAGAIWLVGVRWLARRPAPGVVFSGVLVLLALERFFVEFLRAKDDRFFGILTVAQLISVVIAVVAALLLLRQRNAVSSDGAAAIDGA